MADAGREVLFDMIQKRFEPTMEEVGRDLWTEGPGVSPSSLTSRSMRVGPSRHGTSSRPCGPTR